MANMKVFLSSTYNDLTEYRRAAHDALEQLGLHVIWMESFGARPEESTAACLKEVEESDLFVGIYAHRYGHTSEGLDISITEQEFNHAQKLKRPTFGFIISDDHPWNIKMVEHDKKDKLDALLKKVKKQPVEFFTTPDNLANSIASSVSRYLLATSQKRAQSSGKISFKKLKRYLNSTTRKKLEEDFSSFLVDIKQAILLAKNGGIDSFPELIEFCLIRASLLAQTRVLPAKYYTVKALLDGVEKTKGSVENIGDPGKRALAYVALIVAGSSDLAQKEEFAQRAIELSSQSGGEWEQSSNQSEIGNLLISDLPSFGIKAFRLALETIKKARGIDYIESEIFDTPVNEFENAYKQKPNALHAILPEFIEFVGENGGYSRLLGLAKLLHENKNKMAREILVKSYSELMTNQVKEKKKAYEKERVEREIEHNKKLFVEISIFLGEQSLAENIAQSIKLDFSLKEFAEAVSQIEQGNLTAATKICSLSSIRQEVVDRLFKTGHLKEAIQILEPDDIKIAGDYLPKIVKNGLTDELLNKIPDQSDENEIFSFFYEQRLMDLKVSLAKELASINPTKSQELINAIHSENEAESFKFPFWGEAAFITEAEIKWGKQQAEELIHLCVDDLEKELKNAKQLSKPLNQESDDRKQIKQILNELKELGVTMRLRDNNFIFALSSYAKYREQLEHRLSNDEIIPPELEPGWKFITNEDWVSLENWINNFNFAKLSWRLEDKFVDIVQNLVFLGKLDLATKLATHLERGVKWRADTWISSSSTLKKLSAYDFEGFDEPPQIFLIRAEVISKHGNDLANAYIRLYSEFLIKEQWLDDMLGWHLCDLALFLYKHSDKVNAHKYFCLGVQHWFQYAFETEETWNEIVEKLIKVDFEFQFKVIQELLIWNSTRNIGDVARTTQMFAMILVNNLLYGQVVSILTAIKKARNWRSKDE